jgi:hypothetical protein
VQRQQKKKKKKVEAGVGREFKESAIASRESAKMKQSVQRVRMEEDLKCSTSREVLNLSEQAYVQSVLPVQTTPALLPKVSNSYRLSFHKIK